MWVMDQEKEVMIQKEISFVPGLYKIFDEIMGKNDFFSCSAILVEC